MMRFFCALVPSLVVLQMCSVLYGQDVISARSGMVHFTEGQVFLDDHLLDRKSGSFPSIKEGSTLRTEKGRAEVLLTPGVFLRLDENSSIRMVSTELADTRLTFLNGSAILDQSDPAQANNAITITYKDARAQFPKKGIYRLDGDTGVLQVYSGEAVVTYAGDKTTVDSGHLFFCWLGLQTAKLGDGTEDEFYDWAGDRNQVIAQENQLAKDTNKDPGDVDGDPSAQLGAGNAPYYGGLGSGSGVVPPSVGPQVYPYGAYPYNAYPYGSYVVGNAFFNPFLGVGGSPFFPFGYPALVIVRPYRTTHPLWPHSSTSSLYRPILTGGSTLTPLLPTHVGIRSPALGGYHPTAIPRVGVTVRPSAPAAIHAVGHR
jgi:hypothetical protein